MSLSIIERDQRERGIVVDNAFRPGKGSKPRPFAISHDELGRRLDSIFGWSRRRNQRKSGGKKLSRKQPVPASPFPGIIP